MFSILFETLSFSSLNSCFSSWSSLSISSIFPFTSELFFVLFANHLFSTFNWFISLCSLFFTSVDLWSWFFKSSWTINQNYIISIYDNNLHLQLHVQSFQQQVFHSYSPKSWFSFQRFLSDVWCLFAVPVLHLRTVAPYFSMKY